MKKYLKLFLITCFLFMFASTLVHADTNLNVTIKGDNKALTLTFDKVENATKYIILRSANSDSGYKEIKTITTNKYKDTNVNYNKTYYYKVKAIVNGKSSKTSKVVYKKVVVNKVSDVSLKPSSTQITISFKKENVSGYEIYSSIDNKKWTKVTTIKKSSVVKYVHKKLKANKKYYYKIRSYHKVNGKTYYGVYSDVVNTKTAPSAPTIKCTKYSPFTFNIKLTKTSGSKIYEIYVSTDDKNYKKSLDLNDSSYDGNEIDKQIKVDTPYITYYLKVRACNSNNICGSYSRVKVKTKLTKSKITFVRGNTKEVYLEMADVSYSEGFEIYRSTSKKSGYSKIGTIKSTTKKYTDKKVKIGKTYYYKVKAYMSVNGKRKYGAYSDLKKIKISNNTEMNTAISNAKTLGKNKFNSKKTITNELVNKGYPKKVVTEAITKANINFKNNALKSAKYYYEMYKEIGVGVGENFLRDALKDLEFTTSEMDYAIKNGKFNFYSNLLELVKNIGGYSKKEVIDLLKEIGYKEEDIIKAINEAKIDFKKEALKAIKDEINNINIVHSKKNIINQLKNIRYFTEEEVSYAVSNFSHDWTKEVDKVYEEELIYNLYSKNALIELLKQPDYNFEESEINSALTRLNINFVEVASSKARELFSENGYNESELRVEMEKLKFTTEEINTAIANINFNI